MMLSTLAVALLVLGLTGPSRSTGRCPARAHSASSPVRVYCNCVGHVLVVEVHRTVNIQLQDAEGAGHAEVKRLPDGYRALFTRRPVVVYSETTSIRAMGRQRDRAGEQGNERLTEVFGSVLSLALAVAVTNATKMLDDAEFHDHTKR